MAPRNNENRQEKHQLDEEFEPVVSDTAEEVVMPPRRIIWRNVATMGTLHVMALYGLYLMPWAGWRMWLWTIAVYVMSALGITAGSHRLWAHRSYKAKLPLRIILAVFNLMASQNDIIEWARDHRVHHKYSETHADPHNAKRGFFFAHIGWLFVKKHPQVKEKGQAIDVSDLFQDPVCVIQRKIFKPAMLFCCFVLPALVPWYFWGDSLWTGYFTAGVMRYVLLLNATWCVNSAAHMWGNKPYDKNINPVENFLVVFSAIGEGYHNYHHVFPFDYSASEFGWSSTLNISTMFIDAMAAIGWAYDRKKMSHGHIDRRKNRTGDGSVGFGYKEATKTES